MSDTLIHAHYLSPHFTMEELSVSASHPELVQQLYGAPERLRDNAAKLAHDVLEPVRALCDCPLIVHSGWRPVALNRAVGGSPTSQHLVAQAADVTPAEHSAEWLFLALLRLRPLYPPERIGQVIWYPKQNFCHLALPSFHYPSFSAFVSERPKEYVPVHTAADAWAVVRGAA